MIHKFCIVCTLIALPSGPLLTLRQLPSCATVLLREAWPPVVICVPVQATTDPSGPQVPPPQAASGARRHRPTCTRSRANRRPYLGRPHGFVVPCVPSSPPCRTTRENHSR